MKIETLKKRSEFVHMNKNCEKMATKGMIVQLLRNNDNENKGKIRIGFTATKKIGNAVIRNRVKRRLRAIAQEILPKTSDYSNASYNIVLIGRYVTATRSFKELRGDFIYSLKKLNLY